MTGRISKSTGLLYQVISEEGNTFTCRIKGNWKIKEFGATNPLCVGDKVHFEISGSSEGLITELIPRENYIIRKATNLSRQEHILASNIDQAVLVVTFVQPKTSFGFIDRFLVTAGAYHIPVTLAFNKMDILSEEDLILQEKIISIYTDVGYSCLKLSAMTGVGIPILKKVLEKKHNLFSGHSGSGKSSILNNMCKELRLKTAPISNYHKKGTHCTTFAEMFKISDATYVIDTPGIKELGIVDIPPEEISHYFPEMRDRIRDCRFNNCLHIQEPKCGIQKAVEDGIITRERYESYIGIVAGGDNRK